MKFIKKVRAVIVSVLFLFSSGTVSALDYTFSFSASVPTTGNDPGPVTGTIFGLTDNLSSQGATNVIITSAPDPGSLLALSSSNLLGAGTTWSLTSNSFDVAAGVITSAYFVVNDFVSANGAYLQVGTNWSQYQINDGSGGIVNVNNFLGLYTTPPGGPGATFAAVTAVPEPEIYAMLAAGLGLMGFVARRRKAKIAAAV